MPKQSKPARATAGFTPAELAAVKAAKSQSSRTPAEVLAAFSGSPITCGDMVMAPLSLATFMLLERIESPFVDEQGAIEVTATDTAAAVFILTHPESESHAIIAKGREAFDAAVFAYAARLPASELPAIGLKLKATFEAAFATVVSSQKKTTA